MAGAFGNTGFFFFWGGGNACCLKYVGGSAAVASVTVFLKENITTSRKLPTLLFYCRQAQRTGEKSLKLQPECVFEGDGGIAI